MILDRPRTRVLALVEGRGWSWSAALLAVFAAVPLLWTAGHLFPPINHDVGAVLDVSRRWLSGETLYRDIIDMNLPMVFLLYGIPVLLSRLTGVGIPHMVILCFIAAIIGSSWACWRLAARLFPPPPFLRRMLLALAVPFVLAMLPNGDFAQREHLMLIGALPYLVIAAARATGTPPGRAVCIVSALVAGAVFAMKPHFAGIPALVELYLLVHRGWRRGLRDPVPWTIGAVQVAHAAFLLIATPGYVGFVLPLVLDLYSHLGEGGPLATIADKLAAPTLAALAVLGTAVWLISRAPLTRVLHLAALGGLASYVVQGKGWTYQAYPAIALTLLLFLLLAGELIERMLLRSGSVRRLHATGVVGMLMALVLYQTCLATPPFEKQLGYRSSPVAALVSLVKGYAKRGRIMVLSPGIYPVYPMVNYANATMAMPFLTLWMLQGAYQECEEGTPDYKDLADMGPAERYVYEGIPRDLVRYHPVIVIVDKIVGIPWCNGREFDLLEYFGRNPAFAEEFKNYTKMAEFDRYLIFKRK